MLLLWRHIALGGVKMRSAGGRVAVAQFAEMQLHMVRTHILRFYAGMRIDDLSITELCDVMMQFSETLAPPEHTLLLSATSGWKRI